MIDIKRVNQKVVASLPRVMQPLCRWLPPLLTGVVISRVLNHLLQPELLRQQLDFLAGRQVAIMVTDWEFSFAVGLAGQQLIVTRPVQQYDVMLKASAADLLLLIHNRVDPDTLFFRRRLSMTGDTELGLQVKNLLDTIELQPRLPAPLFMLSSYLAAQVELMQE
ncbi:SCP2 sterol-binding domain-containing protein [Chromatiaceae bacterium AAb-1]|nr:SCP2 sterol-binding domain-containing protein [Chromatiaceae bacterium AAb-1]